MAKVLICDDATFMRMTIREILEGVGHEIVGEASSPEEAIDLYSKLNPDLVTMDLLMRTSGIEAVRGIIDLDPNAKIVVVSVLSEQEGEVVEAVRAGAQGIVMKPIKREILLTEIDRVLSS